MLGISDAPLLEVIAAQGASARLSGMSDAGTAHLRYTMTNLIGKTRSIMVQWSSSDATPAGTSLHLEAVSVPAGCGVAAGEITVSSLPRALIRMIPSCASGAGAEISYRFRVDDLSRGATAADTTVTICFTVCDDS